MAIEACHAETLVCTLPIFRLVEFLLRKGVSKRRSPSICTGVIRPRGTSQYNRSRGFCSASGNQDSDGRPYVRSNSCIPQSSLQAFGPLSGRMTRDLPWLPAACLAGARRPQEHTLPMDPKRRSSSCIRCLLSAVLMGMSAAESSVMLPPEREQDDAKSILAAMSASDVWPSSLTSRAFTLNRRGFSSISGISSTRSVSRWRGCLVDRRPFNW